MKYAAKNTQNSELRLEESVRASTNVQPKTMFTGDNLPILRGIDSESIDLIYLDPPFNSKKKKSAPIGSIAAGAAIEDAWTLDDIDVADLGILGILAEDRPNLANLIDVIGEINGKGDKSYLLMMSSRLIEIHRILKATGAVYLHCDPTMSHSLKLIMDEIFNNHGEGEIMNEITSDFLT